MSDEFGIKMDLRPTNGWSKSGQRATIETPQNTTNTSICVMIDSIGNIFYQIFLDPVRSKDFAGFISKLEEFYR